MVAVCFGFSVGSRCVIIRLCFSEIRSGKNVEDFSPNSFLLTSVSWGQDELSAFLTVSHLVMELILLQLSSEQ